MLVKYYSSVILDRAPIGRKKGHCSSLVHSVNAIVDMFWEYRNTDQFTIFICTLTGNFRHNCSNWRLVQYLNTSLYGSQRKSGLREGFFKEQDHWALMDRWCLIKEERVEGLSITGVTEVKAQK